METRNPTERPMSQERFEIYAGIAASMKERLQEIDGKLSKRKRGYHPVPEVDTLEDAYVVAELRAEEEELKEETKKQAREMRDAGMPEQVWVRHKRTEGRDVRVQLGGTEANPTLAVEFM